VPAVGQVLAAAAGPEMAWIALEEDAGTPLFTGRCCGRSGTGIGRPGGVQHQTMPGRYFTGRRQALTELAGWLAADPAGRPGLRVVTGGPGSGKSAVLARLVTTADLVLHLPPPAAALPVVAAGSIDVALHARAARTDQLLGELGEAFDLDVGQPGQPVEKRVDRLLEELAARQRPVTLVVDALDEAAAPAELAGRLLRPLLDASLIGVRLLVGGRAEALPMLRLRAEEQQAVIDLDDGQAGYFNPADLVGYVRRCLLLDEDPHAPTPYRDRRQLAGQVAEAVAARAGKTFLIAQLEARSLTDAAQPIQVGQPGWERQFPVTVGEAIDRYLARLGPRRAAGTQPARPTRLGLRQRAALQLRRR